MANTLGVYNPTFYAQEGLIQLEKTLGLAGRIYRGYDDERRSYQKGEYISIRRPSTFTAQNAPSAAQDLNTETVSLQLAHWKDVRFAVTDKERAFTGERIIGPRRPAAVALADDIDQKLSTLYKKVPWRHNVAGTPTIDDVLAVQQTLFDNKVPLADDQNMHFMVNGALQRKLLGLSDFVQYQGAGATGEQTQLRGTLGRRLGFEFFPNQNVLTHTSGTAADPDGTLTGAHSKGATSIVVAAVTASSTYKIGDTLVIAGNTQRYAVTADATADGTGNVTLSIFPALVQAYSNGAVVNIALDTNKAACLAFHRNAFALVLAPLPEVGSGLGAVVSTVTNPITGLSIRARVAYNDGNAAVNVTLDVLYGVEILDPNLAVRAHF